MGDRQFVPFKGRSYRMDRQNAFIGGPEVEHGDPKHQKQPQGTTNKPIGSVVDVPDSDDDLWGSWAEGSWTDRHNIAAVKDRIEAMQIITATWQPPSDRHYNPFIEGVNEFQMKTATILSNIAVGSVAFDDIIDDLADLEATFTGLDSLAKRFNVQKRGLKRNASGTEDEDETPKDTQTVMVEDSMPMGDTVLELEESQNQWE